ncbi:putative HET domain-containing protein [Rosellinia necatrix]|uniref:Putative HET domain-containing protein n=1 Tax=Rosellinia necatrix TaxID=77044 RepID=A0A1S8A9A8_ROSNE|nr:putative HET domain-containing protein [Rosellinia necatrix]
MKFYDRDWEFRGTKRDLKELIADAAQIGAEVLERPERIHRLPIAQRMSWAARRETTRPEDMAYCLLGLFEVNMPMLYGEGGTRAFIRLQEEIIKDTNDLSIFAWKTARPGPQKFHGIFANNPAEFRDCGAVQLSQGAAHDPEFALSNKGLRIQTDLTMVASDGAYLLELDCRIGPDPILIWLHHHGGDVYSRSRAHEHGEQSVVHNWMLLGQQRQKMMYIHKWLDAARSVVFEVSHRHAFVLRRNCNVGLDDDDNTYQETFEMSPWLPKFPAYLQFPFAVKRIRPAANWDTARAMLYPSGADYSICFALFSPSYKSLADAADTGYVDRLKKEDQSFAVRLGREPGGGGLWIVILVVIGESLPKITHKDLMDREYLPQGGRVSQSCVVRSRGTWVKITATLEEGELDGQCVYYIDLDMEDALEPRPDV